MTQKQKRYESLVQVYHTELYRFAYWLCQDPSIAEDLVQETFLRAWRSLDALQDEKAAKSWLLTILRRENARRFERKQFDYADVEHDTLEDTKSTSLDDEMEQTVVQRQISQLAPEYREPLLLQVVMGCSGDEIAEILELNKNTVMTRLYRARNQLKEALTNVNESARGASN
ncbi:sigma-70 family RNA polymerase sigma factor [Pseudoalteromonas sp. SMS1]|uniref:RNA polymerase sigma factor n=1 Tax=Pseudoalteromonas luteoviolacea DSM 6061 TaxID=1365250 RepID=A0A166V558_9GAMM|nr:MULTISPECIES: sigma-70 family RNA polymerase sigma factor [Pseudoalteromonas]KZN31724.1 RNA polymerase sigma factor [Pseudoalteromonas luteoviolacea DSM 6061]KZN54584.1 RNA polymerase sigma factor [Pseudoalteromonas luteoviolacea CPMOR-2]MBE0389061.1 RNA polymerase sigma-70 factor, ECF subfamily [Pseudoalteromonas luteoviolacea DSM 6061]MCF2858253.1 sigma-70 family RNA polymerase sigma factor [Pseudoalteromonas sp. SMS1]TQF70417.1 sigma-70 family RNA polymerase sigma factor [Pseudoalteromon